MATAGVVVAACAGGAAPDAEQVEQAQEQAQQAAPKVEEKAEEAAAAVEEKAEEMAAGQYNEAPMLAELVASGELPPVDERLPLNPAVVPHSGRYRQLWRHLPPRLQGRLRPLGTEQNEWSRPDLVQPRPVGTPQPDRVLGG